MSTKQIQDRRQSSESVAQSVHTHKQAVDAGLRAQLLEFFGTEVPTDFVRWLEAVVLRLQKEEGTMVAAGDAHEGELADDPAPRARRNEIDDVLRSKLVTYRTMAGTLLGAEGARLLGVHGAVPDARKARFAWAEGFVDALEDQRIELPDSLVPSMELDRAALAADLRPLVEEMRVALADVLREERELEVTQAAKWKAMETYDEVFGKTARWLEATYRLAGLDEAADWLRPSTKRPGRLAETPAGTSTNPTDAV